MIEATHPILAIDEDVLVLYVPVRNSLAIQVVHRIDDLSEHVSRAIFRQSLMLRRFDALEEIVGRPTTLSGTRGLQQMRVWDQDDFLGLVVLGLWAVRRGLLQERNRSEVHGGLEGGGGRAA